MRFWDKEIIETARRMRINGLTYREIRNELFVPKSTLCIWFNGLPKPDNLYFTNRKEWLVKIRKLSAQKIKNNRIQKIALIANKTRQEVSSWGFLNSIEAQKSLLSMLYWAEGLKLPERGAPVRFTNTDPKMALLFITMLRKCFDLDENRLRVKLYLHWYHKRREVRRFWSNLLQIEESHFEKIYLKRRSKTKRFRKNFMGICFITYGSVDLRQEIMHTAYNIQEVIVGKPTHLRS